MSADRIVKAVLTFHNEGTTYGEQSLYFQTDLDDDAIAALRTDIAALSPLDDDRIPDCSFDMELEEMDDLPLDEQFTKLPSSVPSL